jgi:hypothetical protein
LRRNESDYGLGRIRAWTGARRGFLRRGDLPAGGGRWEAVWEGLDALPYALCADPEAPGALFAGLGDGTILRTQDSGEGWEEFARFPHRVFPAKEGVTDGARTRDLL